jgi:hypothetical protein
MRKHVIALTLIGFLGLTGTAAAVNPRAGGFRGKVHYKVYTGGGAKGKTGHISFAVRHRRIIAVSLFGSFLRDDKTGQTTCNQPEFDAPVGGVAKIKHGKIGRSGAFKATITDSVDTVVLQGKFTGPKKVKGSFTWTHTGGAHCHSDTLHFKAKYIPHSGFPG